MFFNCKEHSNIFRDILNSILTEKSGKIAGEDQIRQVFNTFRDNPLWKTVHIASKLGFIQFFKDNQTEMKKDLNLIAQPQGHSPLVIAILNNR